MDSNAREQVTEWLTGADTCFLLGAGCSRCVGKPLIAELTEKVMETADEKLTDQFNNLKPKSHRSATVEDLITNLMQHRDIFNTESENADQPFTVEDIDRWLKLIRESIVESVSDDWETSDHHKRFLKRLYNNRRGPRDIFSLNYDTILESSLDDLQLHYTDGFRGTNRAWFDVKAFDEEKTAAYRIFKLHGSINWVRDTNGDVRRVPEIKDEPVVVYPSEQKYIQTQYGIYETLIGCFRNRLRSPKKNNYLVVLGYSFNDEHINEAICDSVNADRNNLTIISFIGPEDERDAQCRRICNLESRCDSRFNAFIGDSKTGCFIGNAVESPVKDAILEAEMWRFENLVNLIAKKQP